MKKTLYSQKQFPVLQNRVYPTKQQAKQCTTADIEIVEDQNTGLIYNAIFQPGLVVYDQHYNNEQSLSPRFQAHLNDVAQLIETHIGKQDLVEVGCGKGYFLETLLNRGCDLVGFDPTYEGNNPNVIKQYFAPGVIKQPAKGLILRHVLEHIPDPVNFLFQLKQANGDQGLVYIEVPCFDWICNKRAWFDIFYEHVNYFRQKDFYNMFDHVIDSGHLFGGQYLYVIADLASLKLPSFDPATSIHFPADFTSNLDQIMSEIEKAKAPVCVWGGASKGVVFTMLAERMSKSIDVVVDVNPEKQDRYLPVSGIKVVSPESFVEDWPEDTQVYVMNSNYLQEIKAMSFNKFNYIGVDQ